MMAKSNTILCVGEVLWDVLPEGKKAGGAPMNVAMHLQNMGKQAQLASSIGGDAPGDELLAFLSSNNLDTSLIQKQNSLPTSQVKVTLDAQNDATYSITEPVAWDALELTRELEQAGAHAKMIVYGTLASRREVTRNTVLQLLKNDAWRVIDVNLRPPYNRKDVVAPLLNMADIAKVNQAELTSIVSWYTSKKMEDNERMKWLANHFGLNQVLVSRGAEGASLLYEGDIFYHPGYQVSTADTIGAGDAFVAGYVASLLEGKNPQEHISHACATGAIVASKNGAVPHYDMEEIEALKRK